MVAVVWGGWKVVPLAVHVTVILIPKAIKNVSCKEGRSEDQVFKTKSYIMGTKH